MDSTGKALILEWYRPQSLRKLLKTGSTLIAEEHVFNEGYGLPRRSEHQPVRKLLKTGSALAAEEHIFVPRFSFFCSPLSLPFRAAAPDPDVFPRPGPDPSPDPEPNPVPLPPPDPDPGFPLDPLPTPAPIY
jgi:hypothetical protein